MSESKFTEATEQDLEFEEILNLSPLRNLGGKIYHIVDNEPVYLLTIESAPSWRVKYILKEEGLLAATETFLSGIGGIVYFAWQNSLEIDRTNPTVELLRVHFEKTHEFVNDVFIRANNIL